MIKIIDKSFDHDEFDRHAPHPLQAWAWGEAREKMGIEVLRIGEYLGKNLENVFQATIHPVPYTSFKLAYVPRSVFPSKNVLDFFLDYGKERNWLFVKFEPYSDKSEKNSNSPLIPSRHPLFTPWTQVLDLTYSEEQLLKAMHPKTRYNIRLAAKKGVTVREKSDEEGFEAFAKLYFETTKRQRYFGHDLKYHKTIWDAMKNKIAHILIAYYQDEPLAAYEIFHFRKRLYYVYGGTSDKYRNLMASNLLMWETIKLGKKLGADELDMWGSLPPEYDQANPWAGFTRFKEGYGTKFKEMSSSLDLVIDPLKYHAYGIAYKLREIYLKITA